jgi:hypothetical protein
MRREKQRLQAGGRHHAARLQDLQAKATICGLRIVHNVRASVVWRQMLASTVDDGQHLDAMSLGALVA